MNLNAITIKVPGATPAEIERALAAALAVFQASGTTAAAAWMVTARHEHLCEVGYFDADGNYADPYAGHPLAENEVRPPELDAREIEIIHVWDKADRAANIACFADWSEDRPRPAWGYLELIYDEAQGTSQPEVLSGD